ERCRLPCGIGDEAGALEPVAELRGIAFDLVDAVVVDRSDDVQAFAELDAAGEAELAAEAADVPLGRARRCSGFQAFEVAIENEVDHATDCVRAVLGRGTAGDDV